MPAVEERRGLGHAFGNLFVANLSSSLGDGIARIAAPLLAARITDDPLLISGIAAMALLPWLFFAIPAGIRIDRIDRRHALAIANGVRTALALALFALVAAGSLTIWWLYAVVFVYGMFETVYDGAIRAVVPSIVARADLHRANSRIEAGELVVQNFAAAPFTSALFAVAVLVPPARRRLPVHHGRPHVADSLAPLRRCLAGHHRSTPGGATCRPEPVLAAAPAGPDRQVGAARVMPGTREVPCPVSTGGPRRPEVTCQNRLRGGTTGVRFARPLKPRKAIMAKGSPSADPNDPGRAHSDGAARTARPVTGPRRLSRCRPGAPRSPEHHKPEAGTP